MKVPAYSKLIRWTFFVCGSFLAVGLASGFTAWYFHLWHLPVAGFCAAAAVVVTAYLATPNLKLLSSFTVFAVGALVAWIVLEPSWLPESYGDSAYQPTHLPIMVTYCGGVLGLLVVGLLSRAGPNNSFKPKPLRSGKGMA